MQIFGDLAVPNDLHAKKLYDFFKENEAVFKSKKKIVNFEGLLDDQITVQNKQIVIFNHSSVLPVLKSNNFEVACLANNHTLDLPENLLETRIKLSKHDIVSIGASIKEQNEDNDNDNDNSNWTSWIEDGKEVYLYNACWSFLLYTQMNPADNGAEVNLIDELKLLCDIKTLKDKKPDAIIVTYFHWSFDLETLPFPSYRKFAHDLVEAGVKLVVGCHSHCIQPVEKYKGSTIIYGLGNFYFPNGTYLDGKLNFPDWSQYTLVADYNVSTEEVILHQLKGEGKNDNFVLVYKKSFDLNEKDEVLNLTDLSDKEYLKYYIKNRRKKILIPVFKDYKRGFVNDVKYYFLVKRAFIARKMAESGLRKWQN